jgi:hypothetical protein
VISAAVIGIPSSANRSTWSSEASVSESTRTPSQSKITSCSGVDTSRHGIGPESRIVGRMEIVIAVESLLQ